MLTKEQIKDEHWAAIRGYFRYYEVSDMGRVRSLERKEKCGNQVRVRKYKILKPLLSRDGYYRVALYHQRKPKYFFIHRLVLCAFDNEPANPTMECNHKNGIKTDNYIQNLEWVTSSQNATHAFKNGLRKGHPHHEKMIMSSDGKIYKSIRFAAKWIGTNHQGILNVLKGRRKTCLGLTWQYLPEVKC